jgi:hypothetical protein
MFTSGSFEEIRSLAVPQALRSNNLLHSSKNFLNGECISFVGKNYSNMKDIKITSLDSVFIFLNSSPYSARFENTITKNIICRKELLVNFDSALTEIASSINTKEFSDRKFNQGHEVLRISIILLTLFLLIIKKCWVCFFIDTDISTIVFKEKKPKSFSLNEQTGFEYAKLFYGIELACISLENE